MKERTTRIADFADVVAGGTPSRGVTSYYASGSVAWVKTLDLNLGVVTDTEEKITVSALESFRGNLNPPNSVMVAMYGGKGTIGKTGILGIEAATNQAVASILPAPEKYDSHFLHLQLRHLRPNWMRFSAGNRKDPNINKAVVENMLVWFPDRVCQSRIAAKVNDELAAVKAARQAAHKQLREISSLAGAIVMDTIRNTPTKPYLLGEVLDEVKHGVGPSWADHPVLGATREGLAPAKEQPGKMAPKYKPVTPGTVFYNPMRILIGSIAFVDDDDAPGITSPDYVALRGKPGIVDSRWFYYWLRSHLGAQCILLLARGAVRERMLFNRLADGKIDLPSPEVQEKASRALRELKPLHRALKSKLAEIDLLPQKILAQAFEM
jgi:type I restriction enzyme S subunit